MLYLAIYLGLLVLGYLLFPLFRRIYTDKKGHLLSDSLNKFCAVYIYAITFLGLMIGVCCRLQHIPMMPLILGICLVLLVLYLACRTFSRSLQILFDLILCSLGTMLLFPEDVLWNFPTCATFLLTILFWFFTCRLFCFFDRFPCISLLMSSVWMLGLLLIGQMSAVFPGLMMLLVALVGGSTLICYRYRLFYKIMNLGRPMAFWLGYFWSGIWTYFFIRGHFLAATVVYAYYIYEAGVMLLLFWQSKKIQPLLVQVLSVPEFSKKSVKIIFWNMLLVTLLSVMSIVLTQQKAGLLLSLIVFIFIYMNMQLKNLLHPAPKLREIFSDMKQGIYQIYVQAKSSAQQEKHKKSCQKAKTQRKTIRKRKTKK